MKNFFGGRDLNNTIAHIVAKIDKYNERFTMYECAIGDSVESGKAYRHLQLSQNIYKWLLKKEHLLCCQHCGSVQDVRLRMDFHHAYLLCDECVKS